MILDTLKLDAQLIYEQKAPKPLALKMVEHFVADFLTDSAKTIEGTKAMLLELTGLELAGYCQWGGFDILRVCAFALEDANFHTESAKVLELIKS